MGKSTVTPVEAYEPRRIEMQVVKTPFCGRTASWLSSPSSSNEVNGLPYENIRCDYVPCIAYIYPERNDQHMNEGHSSRSDCPDLFIPDFTRAKVFRESDRWPGNEEFTLTLTDESGKRLPGNILANEKCQ
ncbi:unnamed protein product [Brugia pahangi]|uniref:C2H2-type domain-containing protein n=1 Tax=Brugia pahangi TaxID=6280 RepID=A0A0N4TN46_BRUPA|nr:unnamed protein product [Brugia pahangi]